jgi:pyruvate,orthophosphate dikinase
MDYYNNGNEFPEGVVEVIGEYRRDLEERIGKKLGDANDPLLVSV